MIKLSEIAPAEVELRCAACKRRLGLYSITWDENDEHDALGNRLPPVLGGPDYLNLVRLEAPKGVPEEELWIHAAGERTLTRPRGSGTR